MNCVTIHLWLDDLSERLYGPNKQKNKSFNMITGINESISLVKHFLCVCRCTLHHSVQRGINPPPPKKTPSRPFFAKPPPLNLKTVSAPPLLTFPPYFLVFHELPPPSPPPP